MEGENALPEAGWRKSRTDCRYVSRAVEVACVASAVEGRRLPEQFDVFLSHAHQDQAASRQLVTALEAAGLTVWFDERSIDDFRSIIQSIAQGLARSKAVVAFYSIAFPTRRACQFELTTAFLAAQREGDPLARVLVVNPEHGPDHIQPVQLRDGRYQHWDESDETQTRIAAAISLHLASIDGCLGDIRPFLRPQWYGTQPIGSTRFVGRHVALWEVHSALHSLDYSPLTGATGAGVAQISGLAGAGKTLLAEEYCLRFGAGYPGGIFWLHAFGSHYGPASTPDDREGRRMVQLRALAEAMVPRQITADLTKDEVQGLLRAEIDRRGEPCLWIVDDLPAGMSGEEVRTWLAPHALARSLLTTRSGDYDALAATVKPGMLAPEEAFDLLTALREPTNGQERTTAREIAEELGKHPLAIDVAGAALASYRRWETFGAFREALEDESADVLELAAEFAGELPTGHERSIAKTLLSSIDFLGDDGKDFLRLASLLATAPIPRRLVAAVLAEADHVKDAAEHVASAWTETDSQSLTERIRRPARSVHTLVARTVRFREKDSGRVMVLRGAAIRALLAELSRADDVLQDPDLVDEAAHAQELVRVPTNEEELRLLSWIVFFHHLNGDHVSARRMSLIDVVRSKRLLGPDHEATLRARVNLAEILRDAGQLARARRYQEALLRVMRQRLGDAHNDTLIARANLAETMRVQGDLSAARVHQEDVLDARRHSLGDDHLDTLRARGNLANTIRDQGQLAEARRHQEIVFDLMQRRFGNEHQRTLDARLKLASTLYLQRELDAAYDHEVAVVSIRLRTLGEEHPRTLVARGNLAETMKALGDVEGSRAEQVRVLNTRERVLGADHPSTVSTRYKLAQTLRQLGDSDGAEKHLQAVLTANLELYGERHHETLKVRNDLALTQRGRGDLTAARLQQEAILSGARELLGEEHRETLVVRANLAGTLAQMGEIEGAIQHLSEVWRGLGRTLGEDHPDTSNVRTMLAGLVYERGDVIGAVAHLQEVVRANMRVLGAGHPETLRAKAYLAAILDSEAS